VCYIREFADVLVEFRQKVGASRVRVFHQSFRDEEFQVELALRRTTRRRGKPSAVLRRTAFSSTHRNQRG